VSKKWNDERLDASQVATDRLFKAQGEITAEIARIMERKRLGDFTSADEEKLQELKKLWMTLAREVADMGHRLFDGAPLPPERLQ
jgi:hypothetical protein